MALETGTYISDLVVTNPTGADAKSTADDHLRLLKSTVKNTFPNVTGAVTPSHTVLNYLTGVTSAVQTQLDAKAPLASPTFTGTPAAPTATTGTSSTQVATTAFVASSIASVNSQTALVVAVVSATTQTATAGSHYVLTNVSQTTLTLPATPSSGQTVAVTVANSRTDNVIARNGQTLMGLAEDMTIDSASATITLRFLNNDWRMV